MESDLLCFIPEYLCSGFAEHIFKGVGCCAIILFQGVGVDVHGEACAGVPEPVLHGLDVRSIADEERGLGVPELVEVQPRVLPLLVAHTALGIGVLVGVAVAPEPVLDTEPPEPP